MTDGHVFRHGVYPGYFLTFGTAALATEAARKACLADLVVAPTPAGTSRHPAPVPGKQGRGFCV